MNWSHLLNTPVPVTSQIQHTQRKIYKNKTPCLYDLGLPGVLGNSAGKESPCNAGNPGLILGLARSLGGGHDNSLQYSRLENPHGQKSLVGYSPRGHTESDVTERLSTAQVVLVMRKPPADAGDIGTQVRSLGQEDPLEKEMVTHSSILAWGIPRTGSLADYSSRGHKESHTTEVT